MRISDEELIGYLKKNERRKRYRLGDGAAYTFRLEPSPRPTERMPYAVVLFSCVPSAWEKDHEIAACFAIGCLDRYNAGAKRPDDFVAKAGPSRSRRGRYFRELLADLEYELIRDAGQHPAAEAHP